MKKNAFTLIELLIVVAIIAILAAIAVPNFLEAQTRSKVARVKADLRSIGVALESYAVDYSRFPDADHPDYYSHVYIEYMHQLSTPVAYLTSLNLIDPFTVRAGRMPAHLGSPAEGWKGSYLYLTYDGLWVASFWGSGSLGLRRGFVADSQGPSRRYSGIEHYGYACIMNLPPGDPYFAWLSGITQGIDGGPPVHAKEDVLYNPTNGTTSFGGIARYGGDIPGCPQSVGG